MDAPGDRLKHQFSDFSLEEADELLLDRLLPRHRAILVMPGNYRALAKALAVPIGTVKSRLHRARAALIKLRASGSRVGST